MSDLINRLDLQGLAEDRQTDRDRLDDRQPTSMASAGDGSIKAVERLARAYEHGVEQPEEMSFRSSPDRQKMNIDVARTRFETTRFYGMMEPSEREAVDRRATEAINAGLQWCESPIEKYILPWLVYQDWRPFAEAPVPVFAPTDAVPPDSSIFIVPQFNFGCFRLDFGIVAKRRDTSILIALECDGAAFHGGEEDRRRDAYLAGFRIPTVRASGSEIKDFPERVVARVINIIEAWRRRL